MRLLARFFDRCPHGVPYRYPDWCIDCEMDELDLPPTSTRNAFNKENGNG